jgi:virulence factor
VTSREGGLSQALGTLAAPRAHAQFVMDRRAGVDRETLVLHGQERLAEVTDLDRLAVFVSGEQHLVGVGMWDSLLKRRGFVDLVDHVLACVGRPDACEVSAARVLTSHRVAEELLARAQSDD